MINSKPILNLGTLLSNSESRLGSGGGLTVRGRGGLRKSLRVCPILRCPKEQLSSCQRKQKSGKGSLSSLSGVKVLINASRTCQAIMKRW